MYVCATIPPILEASYRVTRSMKANHAVSLFLFSFSKVTVCAFDKENGAPRKKKTRHREPHLSQDPVLSSFRVLCCVLISYHQHPNISHYSGPCTFAPQSITFVSIHTLRHNQCIHVIHCWTSLIHCMI